MLRFRSITRRSSIEATESDVHSEHLLEEKQGKTRRRNAWTPPPLPLILIVAWCIVQSTWNFQFVLSKNLGLLDDRKATSGSNLRVASKSKSDSLPPALEGDQTNNDSADVCPPLPDRLLHWAKPPQLIPLTKDEVEEQRRIMTKTNFGTMGDSILRCPPTKPSVLSSTRRNAETDCRGILKTYRSKVVYEHVKRALTILADTRIVPRILFSDDATRTLVEESMGQVTMMNSPIPVDFDQQLRRILCILRQHKVIHRDLTFPNFVVDEVSGMIFLIDFGDAFLGVDGGIMANVFPSSQEQDRPFNWRNLVNLLNIWLSNYDEEVRLEEFIAFTQPKVHGERQWRPKPWKWTSHRQMKEGSLFLAQELLHKKL